MSFRNAWNCPDMIYLVLHVGASKDFFYMYAI